MSVKDVDFYRILSTWMVFGDTFEKDEDFGRSAPFFHLFHTMKKILTLILFFLIAFNAIHANITYNLSDDGTLTISGTDMPNYHDIYGSYPWDSQRNKIKKIIIEDGVTNIAYGAFYACSHLCSVTLPNSLTSIGGYAFRNCSNLSSISIPNSVTDIGEYAFKECTSLTSITIPNSMISIENNVFIGCSGLISINIPNSVTNIGNSAFSGCSSLTSVIIPKSVRSIKEDVFNYCSSLSTITVENGNPIYDSRENCNAIIETKSNTLIAGCKNTIIPESVIRIGDCAFGGCIGLSSITIPNSITRIEQSAFYGCKGLTSISIPSSVSRIRNAAFSGCSNLTSVTFYEGVTDLGSSVFSNCTSLTSITIPNSMKYIGSTTFMGCSGLTSLTCKAVNPPSCDDNCFSGIDKSIPLYVPGNCINAYIEAKQWNNFANILPIPADPTLTLTLTDKNSELKDGCYQKGNVTLIRNNMSVGEYATFCLPFDIDINKTTEFFSKVYVPLNIGLLKPSGELLLLLDEGNDNSIIKAGQTFVAKCKTSDVVFENCVDATFDESTQNPTLSNVKIYNFDGVSGALTQNKDVKIKIGGSYSQLNNLDKNNYRILFGNGSFDSTTNIIPFQMYVYMDGVGSISSKVTSISFEFNDVTTDIKALQMTNDKSPIYDLNGRIVYEKNLKPGLYIKNGKKVVIK